MPDVKPKVLVMFLWTPIKRLVATDFERKADQEWFNLPLILRKCKQRGKKKKKKEKERNGNTSTYVWSLDVRDSSLSPTTVQTANEHSSSQTWLKSDTVMSSNLRPSYVTVCSRDICRKASSRSSRSTLRSLRSGQVPSEFLSLLHTCVICTLLVTFDRCVVAVFPCSSLNGDLECNGYPMLTCRNILSL